MSKTWENRALSKSKVALVEMQRQLEIISKDVEQATGILVLTLFIFLMELVYLQILINLHFGQVKVTVKMAQVIQMLYLELDIMVY